MKKVNVITVNLNNKDGLRRTMESVIGQTCFDQIDYIVIDGGSTDGSKDVIEEYSPHIFYGVSEKDNGIYNAMNKGIDVADNEYTIFLNSGDYFYGCNVVRKMCEHLDADIVYGDLKIHQANPKDGCFLKEYTDVIPADYFTYEALPHEAAFVRTDLLKRKRFREDYRIISDTIFFHEAIVEEKATYRHENCVVTNFFLGGVSSNYPKVEREKRRYFEEKGKFIV